MPQFGEVRVDFVTFTTGVSPSGANVTASVSGLIKNPTFSGDVVVKNNLDVEGNITISGTVTGNAAGFTSVTGTTVTGTTANFTSGVFTTQISGATITGDAGQFNTLTGNAAGFTSITGTTITGTTANFVTVSGTTVTGNTGNFTTATTTTANVTSGIFASGTAAAPSVSVGTTDNGIYSPGTDQVAISTNGTQALYIDSDGDILVADGNRMEIDEVRARDGDGLKLFDDAGAGIFVQDGGNVGIGTSSPGKLLEVSSSTDATIRINDPATIGAVDRYIGGIEYYTNDSSGGAKVACSIKGYHVDISGNGRLQFATGAETTAMTIDGSQRVGIGTTQVDTKLVVAGNNNGSANNNTLRFVDTDTSSSATQESGRIEFYTSDTTQSGVHSYIAGQTLDTNGNGGLTFGTGLAGSATEAAQIDSSGRLLVGTSSTLPGATDSFLQIRGNSSGSQYEGKIALAASVANGSVTSSNTLGAIYFGTDAGGTAALIQGFADGGWGTSDYPGRLVFSTTADGASSPTERMRITSNGQTYWAASNPTISSFGTSIGRSGVPGLFETFRNVDGSGSVVFAGGSAGQAQIRGDGDLENTNNAYGALSDIKLKENVIDANSQWSDIKALQVRNYNFKEETGYSTHTQIGLIAQEVELVSPGLVGESINEETGTVTKSVNYSVLYMKAVKALQEAMERIETLEAKVAALESA